MKKKKESVLTYIYLAYQADPAHFFTYTLIVVFLGVYPVLWSTVLAEAIDQAGSYMNIQTGLLRLILIFLLLIAVYGSKSLVSNYVDMIAIKIKAAMGEMLNEIFIRKINRIKYEQIENEEMYQLIERLGGQLEEEFFSKMRICMYTVEIALNYLSLAFFVGRVKWWFACIIIFLSVPLLYVGYVSGEKTYEVKKAAARLKREASYLQDILVSREYAAERTVFQYGEAMANRYQDKFLEYKKSETKNNFLSTWNMEKTGLVANGTMLLVVLWIAYEVWLGETSVGVLSALVSQVMVFSGSIRWRMSSICKNYIEGKLFLQDWNTFLSIPEKCSLTLTEEKKIRGDVEKIEFRDVSFKYPGAENYAVHRINLSLHRGESYVLVGENGSGKSTLLKLLIGLYEDYEGDIFINDINIRDISEKERSGLFGVTFQDYRCYPLSVRQNIQIGRDAEEEKKNDALELGRLFHMLCMEDFIEKLSNRDETLIGKFGEGYTDVSGGETQKIAIARCIYSDAPVYVFDEPTAAIDPSTESQLYHVFRDEGKNKLKLVVSHRLGIAAVMDRIIFMKNGEIDMVGTHEELMRINDEYRSMFEKQRSWYVQ